MKTSNAACLMGTVVLLICLVTGCNELKDWRDSQIKTSHELAASDRVNPPATPISVPAAIRQELPWDDTLTVLQFATVNDVEHIIVLSAWDASHTAQWLIVKLDELGYTSGENASAILDGVTFHKNAGKYRKLYADLELNVAEQCTVTFELSR